MTTRGAGLILRRGPAGGARRTLLQALLAVGTAVAGLAAWQGRTVLLLVFLGSMPGSSSSCGSER